MEIICPRENHIDNKIIKGKFFKLLENSRKVQMKNELYKHPSVNSNSITITVKRNDIFIDILRLKYSFFYKGHYCAVRKPHSKDIAIAIAQQ